MVFDFWFGLKGGARYHWVSSSNGLERSFEKLVIVESISNDGALVERKPEPIQRVGSWVERKESSPIMVVVVVEKRSVVS